jgi:hypothetical protein
MTAAEPVMRDLAQVQVDVPPAEVEQFATTGAGVCGEAVEGE